MQVALCLRKVVFDMTTDLDSNEQQQQIWPHVGQ